jgi:hypothetical protein
VAKIAVDEHAELVDLLLEMLADLALDGNRDRPLLVGKPVPADETLSQ